VLAVLAAEGRSLLPGVDQSVHLLLLAVSGLLLLLLLGHLPALLRVLAALLRSPRAALARRLADSALTGSEGKLQAVRKEVSG
jgi:hypothetical protein